MRSIFSKIAFTAALMLAITFTFSCSAVDDAINGSSSSSGGSEQKCGGVVYDADTYRCEAGELIGKCKGVDYYPAYQQCVGGVVVDGSPSSSSRGSSSSVKSGGGTTAYSLDGVWSTESGLTQITVSGSTGVFSVCPSTNPDPLSQSATDKGYFGVGKQYWRNITSTGNLTWSGQILLIQYNTSNPNVATGTTWGNVTFTLSADGQTLTVGDQIWTRSTYSLDGIWSTESGLTQITVSGSTGVFSVCPSTNPDPLSQSATDKGYFGVGKQYWRNITSTGNLTWSGQVLQVLFYPSNPNVAIGTTWGNATFTMSADGQTLTVGDITWTRKQ